MQPTYPFDPYDWTTITPLFQALIAAPVVDGDFMSWLDHWNQLDIAVWDAYTVLKRPAYYDTRDQATEQAYATYVQELFSTYLGLTNALINRALTLQPTPPAPAYAQLWQRWRNQHELFHPASLPIQAEISQLEQQYREIMNQFDPAQPVAYWLERREALNGLMLRLLHLRRALAKTSGQPTFLAYRWRELNRLGYTIADCQAFHHAVETVVVPLVAQLRAEGNSLNQSSAEITDLALLVDGIERILQQIDPTFGAIFQRLRDGYLDLGSRPGKAGAVEEWFLPGAGLPYLHIATYNAGSVLHESGHGMHDYLSFQAHGSIWNLNGPEEFQEFAATSMDLLAWPYYAQEQGGPYTAAESVIARQSVLHYYLGALTNCTLEDAFEHWVYGEAPADVTPAELDTKWLELKARFTPWEECDPNSAEAQSGWQRWRWSLYRMPLYMITYPLAIVGACQFGRFVEKDRASAIYNYKAALTSGNTCSLPALFEAVGITFPFTQLVVKEAVQVVIDRYRILRSEWAATHRQFKGEISPATRADITEIAASFPDWGARHKHDQRWQQQQQGNAVYLIARQQGQPVGHAYLKWHGADDPHVVQQRTGLCPDLEDIFVLGHWRGHGIGTALIHMAEALVTAQGFQSIGLSVGIENPAARRLYERLGYQDAGFGVYTEQGAHLDEHGHTQVWEERCIYLIKQLVSAQRLAWTEDTDSDDNPT